jgi:hypothetical protein
MKISTFSLLLTAALLIPTLAPAQLLVFKGSSSDSYVGEGHTWRVASKTIIVVDYATGNFGRLDYTTINGSKRYTTATYTNAHLVQVSGPNGAPYTAVTRIPSDCYEAENPNREPLYFSGANSTLTITPGTTVSFPKTLSAGGRGFFYSSSNHLPVLSQGAVLGIFSATESKARSGDTLDSAMAGYIAYVEGQGYTR